MPKAVSGKFKKHSTNYRGVRHSIHKTRKNPNTGKMDQCFFLRYKLDGQLKEEALGWGSEGWNAYTASQELAELKKNQRLGEGPRTLSEKRELKRLQEEAERLLLEEEARNNRTFGKIFKDFYLPQAKADKSESSVVREKSLFKKWIKPTIGSVPIQAVTPSNLEEIKNKMGEAELSARSIQYALAVVRQVFNFAIDRDFYLGQNPSSKVKRLKFDNKRTAFLTKEQADDLLKELKKRSTKTYHIALLSLHCGLRADEIFSLCWGHIHLKREQIKIVDSKDKENDRFAYMTSTISEMFRSLDKGKRNELVFPNRKGNKRKQASNAFNRAVDKLKFNEGIEDRREKIVFHSLRHTYASLHIQSGTPLYTLQKLLGHKSYKMVERYAHLGETPQKAATIIFQKFIKNTLLK